jgi:tryptophan 2,3-dioxygenase
MAISRNEAMQLTFTRFRATLVCVEETMETQNITLSIPKEVLLKVKLLAVKRQTSVSGLLTQMLERLVQQEDAYAHAQQRHLQCLEQGIDLGTGGQILTQRDELHERA